MGAAVASSDHSESGWGEAKADPMQRRNGHSQPPVTLCMLTGPQA